LGRLVFGHGFGTFTRLFLLLEERFSACALGSLICSQLALLPELALKGMYINTPPHLLFRPTRFSRW
jgi:hypothetical protein